MTTDSKENKEVEQEPDNKSVQEDSNKAEETINPGTNLTDAEKAMIDKFTDIFNDKLAQTMEKYDKKVEELNTQLAEKEKEINKLRKVNSEILMNTDLRANKKDEIDFNDTDFNDVDWDAEAKGLLDKIDKKIS